MRNILPKEDICRFFDKNVFFEEYTLKDISAIKEMKPEVLFGLTLCIWNRIVQFKLHPVNPSALADYFERRDPDTYLEVSKILGINIIKDLYYARGSAGNPPPDCVPVSELFAAHIYPNNLCLADIGLSKPDAVENRNGSTISSRKEVLYKMIDNAVSYGKSKGCNYLMIRVKTAYHADIFTRYGFFIEDSMMERMNLRFGTEIPMVRQI